MIFRISIFAPIILALLIKITGVSLFGLWQLVLFVLAVFGFSRFWEDVKNNRVLKIAIVSFIIYSCLCIASSFAASTNLKAATYQVLSNLKPLLSICIGYSIAWSSNSIMYFSGFVKWIWLPAMFFVIFEWFMPGVYYALFLNGPSIDHTGVFPSRAVSFYEHPSFLASSAACLLILTVALRDLLKFSKNQYCLLVTAYSSLLIFSVQRQELIACVAAVALLFLVSKPEKFILRLTVVSIFLALAGVAFWAIYSENILIESESWGFGTYGAVNHPRAQIFEGAWYLADLNFPLGSGLGTYGGAGAEKFNLSIYDELGFQKYWWFEVEDFLMDTYWPNSIAESGYFGSLALLGFYLSLFVFALKSSLRAENKVRQYWSCAAVLMLYMLILSFSSPAFQDLRLYIIPAMMYGLASQLSKKFG